MVPRRAKKPRRVMQARVSSLVNIDGWFGMFFKPIVLDAPWIPRFRASSLVPLTPAPFHVLGW